MEYDLNYCTIQHWDDDIALIEINDGIEIDATMAAELIHIANKELGSSFGILSNRINSYSLSFDAMAALANHENLAAVAIVVPSNKSRLLVDAQNFLISAIKKKPIKVFLDTTSATHWLKSTLQNKQNIPATTRQGLKTEE
ncbi:MAG: hypothetical protein COB30_011905 [Ectothiorhodospiraceae bacterium]|nr:hypothetical protein [Ectothiorhodospiraceae bacterium]